MGFLELVAIVAAAVLGWRRGTFGRHEVKAIAIIVLGWTAVTAVAGIRNFSLAGLLTVLVIRALLIGVPYGAGVLSNRWHRRSS